MVINGSFSDEGCRPLGQGVVRKFRHSLCVSGSPTAPLQLILVDVITVIRHTWEILLPFSLHPFSPCQIISASCLVVLRSTCLNPNLFGFGSRSQSGLLPLQMYVFDPCYVCYIWMLILDSCSDRMLVTVLLLHLCPAPPRLTPSDEDFPSSSE